MILQILALARRLAIAPHVPTHSQSWVDMESNCLIEFMRYSKADKANPSSPTIRGWLGYRHASSPRLRWHLKRRLRWRAKTVGAYIFWAMPSRARHARWERYSPESSHRSCVAARRFPRLAYF